MITVHKDFLPELMAETLYDKTMDAPENWWKTSYVVNGGIPSNLTQSVRHTMIDMETQLKASLQSGGFCYRFKRSVDHVDDCPCYQCEFKHYVSYVLKDFIEKEYEMENLELNTMFFSVYKSGDFLSMHHDEDRGDVAFVLNLTKYWRPEYGGVFHCGGKYVEPTFNTLMLMDLGKTGIDHFVSEVSARSPFPRIAVSGWFRKSK